MKRANNHGEEDLYNIPASSEERKIREHWMESAELFIRATEMRVMQPISSSCGRSTDALGVQQSRAQTQCSSAVHTTPSCRDRRLLNGLFSRTTWISQHQKG